jgi:hypothetical protein
MVDFNNAVDIEQERIALYGQRMREFSESEGYKEFKATILDVIREEAFSIFDSLPADDTVGIIGAQQMKKVVDYIEGKVDGSVEEGRLALDYLSNSNPE